MVYLRFAGYLCDTLVTIMIIFSYILLASSLCWIIIKAYRKPGVFLNQRKQEAVLFLQVEFISWGVCNPSLPHAQHAVCQNIHLNYPVSVFLRNNSDTGLQQLKENRFKTDSQLKLLLCPLNLNPLPQSILIIWFRMIC